MAMARSESRRGRPLSFGAAEASFPRCQRRQPDRLDTTRRRLNGVTSNNERYIEMTNVKAAAVQISPVLYSREGTVEKVVEKIVALGRQGVQFATFPEAIVPYYPYFSTLQRPIELADQQLLLLDQAVTVPSEATHAVGDACAQAGIVVSIGINERDG